MEPFQQVIPRDAPAQQQGATGTQIPGATKAPMGVKGPDGKTYNFPADASDDEILKFFEQQKAPHDTTTPQAPNSFGDNVLAFVQGGLEQVNPITMLTSLYQGVMHPIDTVTGLASQQIQQFKDAKKFYDEGRYSEAYGATMAGLLPLVGPQARAIGEDIGSGNVAHGLGGATGLVGMMTAPSLAKGAAKAAEGTRVGEAIGTTAEDMAKRRMVDVMAPKVGANKVRFGNMAEDVASQVAREPGMTSRTRVTLLRKIGDKLAGAEGELDAAADARNPGAAFSTAPILSDLRKARAALTAEAVEGSRITPEYTGTGGRTITPSQEASIAPVLSSGETANVFRSATDPLPVVGQKARPIGEDVVPAPNRTRVAQIDQAIKEIEQLGPVARYESLRRIRASYDQIAKVKYSPSMTADFLAKNAEASGAADVTRALRDNLAKMDPATAKANQSYALWRKASDVMEAAAEVERVRPTVGRKIAARFAGAVTGEAAGGPAGMAVGVLVAPIVDELLNSGPTMKITSARALQSLADALKSGNADQIAGSISRARAVVVSLNAINRNQQP